VKVYVLRVDRYIVLVSSSFDAAATAARQVMDIRYGKGNYKEQGQPGWSLALFPHTAKVGEDTEVRVQEYTIDATEAFDCILHIEQERKY
jgi:hypothetical protein